MKLPISTLEIIPRPDNPGVRDDETYYQLIELFRRPVLSRHLYANEQAATCTDCNQPAIMRIFEFNRDSWYWCGRCEIGG